jgi:hypothetical protein
MSIKFTFHKDFIGWPMFIHIKFSKIPMVMGTLSFVISSTNLFKFSANLEDTFIDRLIIDRIR